MALSQTQLAQHVGQALKKADGPVILAYAWEGDWGNSAHLNVNNEQVPVQVCGSPLAVREALLDSGECSKVLLVQFAESQLSQDVLARLFRHRLLHVDRWQMVADAYGVNRLDPRLYALPWIADLLLEIAPKQKFRTALTYDDALELCVAKALGLGGDDLDLQYLQTHLQSNAVGWSELSDAQRTEYERYLASTLGTAADGITGAVAAGNSHALLGIGLACEVLFSTEAERAGPLQDARIRLEPRLNNARISTSDGQKWAEAARRVVKRLDERARQADFRAAAELLHDLGADKQIFLSTVLPEALDSRLDRLAQAIRAYLRNGKAFADIENALEHVKSHELIPSNHPGPAIADMTVRLCRRERMAGKNSRVEFGADAYLQGGAWEDWARRSLRGVRPESLARVVTKLLDRVAERRAESDQQFAKQLARYAENDELPPRVIGVESALGEVIAPLASKTPTLLLVLDGMSWDVYLPIARELERTGWSPWKTQHSAASLLATTPSVTEYSRTSLLSGCLAQGNASKEKKAFKDNADLKTVSRAGKAPILLHKGDIQEGTQLSVQARAAISDTRTSVVGMVINAIDDALAKSEQVRIDWGIESIPLLAAILSEARIAGRAVVITSDHGHVLERNTEYRKTGDAERWRHADGDVDSGELRIRGPRVQALTGAPIIAPWRENIRYSIKKNGYHGGASQQEMLAPIGIWTPSSAPCEDYIADLHPAPAWWNGVTIEAEAPKQAAPDNASSSMQDDLFLAQPKAHWIDDLLKSDVMQAQRERVGRLALDDERLRALLSCLEKHGERASTEQLAAAINQPLLRIRGVLTMLQRMLNIDGFPVIKIESGVPMVLLDRRLLNTQFEL